jgi:hypothetical protein
MSAAILPDGSVVVRLPTQTVHVDVRTRAIHLRAASRDELAGSILESFPLAAVDRVRLIRSETQAHELHLILRSGREISLGTAPAHEVALMTARIVADVTRCKIEIAGNGPQPLPGAGHRTLSAEQVRLRAADGDPNPSAASPWDEPSPMIDELPTSRIFQKIVPEGPLPVIVDPEADTWKPPVPRFPSDPPDYARAVAALAALEKMIDGAMEEDPLDLTVCRPASSEEVMMRIDRAEPVLSSPLAEGQMDPTHIAKTRVRLRPESWIDAHEERDPTMEDAFDTGQSEWEDPFRV